MSVVVWSFALRKEDVHLVPRESMMRYALERSRHARCPLSERLLISRPPPRAEEIPIGVHVECITHFPRKNKLVFDVMREQALSHLEPE